MTTSEPRQKPNGILRAPPRTTVTKAPSPSSPCENVQRERHRLFGPTDHLVAALRRRRVNKTSFFLQA